MKKFFLNFGINTFFIIGPTNYIILLLNFILKFKKIIQQKNLKPLDNIFNKISLRFNGYNFFINIKKLNYLSQEEDTFGLIREIFFRNVYLKNFSIKNYNEFICFDLGCNRGVFSVIASKIFKFVTCIDLQQKYENCIHEIMLNNNQKNYEFISGIVGSLKVSERLGSNQKTINLNDIIRKRSNGEKIFLKIDIEGGEFKLFEEIDLSLINTIVIEIHSNKGNLNQILDKLKNNNFKFFCFDDQLTNLTYPNKKISFVTAEK